MSEPEETLDLVDDLDQSVGVIERSQAWAKQVRWVRVVNAFVVNAQGQLWIPRRSANKRMFPLCLDMSVGGHVGAGETYEQAIERETREEIGLELGKVPHRELGYLNPAQCGLSAWMKVWEIGLEDTPNYNPNDFVSSEWIEPKRLLGRIQQGDAAKGDLARLVWLFYPSS